MLLNRIIYGVFVAACFGFSMAYTGGITAVLLAIAVAYPFAAAGITAVQLAFLKADFPVRHATFSKNTPFDFSINVTNGSIFPCVPLELTCTLPDAESGRFIRKRVYVSLSPFASAKLVIEGRHQYRGCYKATAERIAAVDPLRIIRISRRMNDEMTMVFLPRKLELEDVLSSCEGEQSFSKPNSVASEKEDFSHVRDYRPGDNIQFIHWKLTAKQDDFMIKQFDSVSDRRAYVICDWSVGSGGDSYLRADTIIETALSFVKAALDLDVHSTVQIGQAPDFEKVSVTSTSEYDMFYEMMSVLPVPTDGRKEDFLALIDNEDMGQAAALILITANLTEEVLFRAREYAKSTEVYLAYVNLGGAPVDGGLYEQPFLFFNIRGSGEDALKLAEAMSKAAD